MLVDTRRAVAGTLRRARPSTFVFVERCVLDDPRLSLAAKGLFAVVAAWEEGHSSPTDESVAPLLDELVAAGYAAVGDDGEVAVGLAAEGDDEGQAVPRTVPAPQTGTEDNGWAYAISDASGAHVKIGCSQNVARRLKVLQTGYPTALRVLWQGAGGASMEAHLHARFARRRIRGEWFDFAGVDALKLITKAASGFRGVAK
ncbi:GIY-YIG nuclease family protein (plasmid) [Streptomyces sp. NBC_01723]|uniref:GIY-YIG nuclease family protein n=1 Tax=Streptomyces sp. NBC_01723 TaxID=2975921 RepID=UPI002E31A722|nr:GIY-YIG nuclease family protein [Streptomyces sp. NBC_01723]